jgi:poly(3-hydroxybutyrate) depolymerase
MVGPAPRPFGRGCDEEEPISDAAFRRFAIASIDTPEGVCPVIERRLGSLRFCVLRSFSRSSAVGRRALIVAPLAGAFPILLRDLVIALLRELDEVAITDWPDARYVVQRVGSFGLADNILHVEAMMRMLGPRLHVVAVCQGVVPALAATALLSRADDAAAPLSLTLMGGPVDPLANPSRVVQLLRERPIDWFAKNVIERVEDSYPGRGRAIYPRTHQFETFSGYALRHTLERRELFWKLLIDDGEDPIRFPFASLCWSLMDLPAELLLDSVREIFHGGSLAKGGVGAGRRKIDLGAIAHTALATVEGAEDDISPPGQTSAAHALCHAVPDALRRRLVVPDSGHFSLFHGQTARRTVVPFIAELAKAAQRQAC